MIALVFGLLGLIVGSFLNVVILRFGERSLAGRSACVHCGKQLRGFDMVPVASWLVLRGRCRSCRARISIQYPLVEAATGMLFAGIGAAALPPAPTALALAMVALLVCIFVYDLYHTIIPDLWVYSFVALAFLSQFAMSLPLDFSWTLFLFAGPIAALPLFALWGMSRGAWMGFGDVKLALGIGWLLGFPYGLIAIFLGFLIGAVVSVGILLPLPHIIRFFGITNLEGRGAPLTMKSEVPFGPFLITSCLLIWFLLLYNVPVPLLI